MTKLIVSLLLALGLTGCSITPTSFSGGCTVTVVSIEEMDSLLVLPSSECSYVDINAEGKVGAGLGV